MPREKKPTPWEHSEEKKLLRQDILDGKVPSTMKPRDAYNMRNGICKKYKQTNFTTSLRNLRESLKKNQEKADSDSAALAHDRQLHPKGNETCDGCGYPRWEGSEAERLLKDDIANGRHEGLKPLQFRLTRQCYQAFPAKVFRNHVEKEINKRRERSRWKNRKKRRR